MLEAHQARTPRRVFYVLSGYLEARGYYSYIPGDSTQDHSRLRGPPRYTAVVSAYGILIESELRPTSLPQ